MLSLVPENTDQIMVTKPAQQIDNKITQSYMSQFPAEMVDVFGGIETLVMAQKIL
jgi:hypothetical protein